MGEVVMTVIERRRPPSPPKIDKWWPVTRYAAFFLALSRATTGQRRQRGLERQHFFFTLALPTRRAPVLDSPHHR